MSKLTFHPRRQKLVQNEAGRNEWQAEIETKQMPAKETAIIVCDMWDNHWSRGALERSTAMAPQMNEVLKSAREQGVSIIHAPSETIAPYENTPARQRIKAIPLVNLPEPIEHDDPPLPIDDSDGGSDTNETPERVDQAVWTKQIDIIEIDQERDVLSDDGREVYSFMQHRDIRYLVMMGVHTNMCVLDRPFAIKQMVRWGVAIVLCRDMTDALCNPARRPYVSQAEGTRLVIEYIEKFWCPSILSEDLTGKE